jgi:integrase/recombinase XerD
MWSDLVKDFLGECVSKNLSPKTLRFYTDGLKFFVSYLEQRELFTLSDATPNVIRDYISSCNETLNIGGTLARLRAARAFFGFLENEELLEVNPFKKVKFPRQKQEIQKSLTIDEYKILVQTALMGNNPMRDVGIISVLYDTAIRASEMLGLDVDDLAKDRGFLLIRDAKGGKERFVPLSRETQKNLTRYLVKERRNTREKALFLTRHGIRFTYDSLKAMLIRLFERANLPYKSPHCWRRGSASQYIRNGGNVFALQKLLGHSTLHMSQRYVQLSKGDLFDLHQSVSPVSRSRA